MNTLLKATLMLLGAACVLLFAGGFPRMGAPAVYGGGALLLLGALVGLLALWGAWRLAKGQVARLLFGLFCAFMAGTGLVMLLRYGGKALDYAGIGGAMWFGALGMGCIALVGVIFAGLFGFFAKKLMHARLWLAGAHVAAFFVLLGAFVDAAAERRYEAHLPADGSKELHLVHNDGGGCALPFSLWAEDFAIDFYEGAPTYSLMGFEHGGTVLRQLGSVQVQGNELVYGEERWPLEQLRRVAGMRPFLVVEQGRLIMQDAPAVKEYRATCRVQTQYRGRTETRREVLRVNAPLEVQGWQVALLSYEPQDGGYVLLLQLRRAPGRFLALTGMLGLILCTACWCWGGRKEVAHA